MEDGRVVLSNGEDVTVNTPALIPARMHYFFLYVQEHNIQPEPGGSVCSADRLRSRDIRLSSDPFLYVIRLWETHTCREVKFC